MGAARAALGVRATPLADLRAPRRRSLGAGGEAPRGRATPLAGRRAQRGSPFTARWDAARGRATSRAGGNQARPEVAAWLAARPLWPRVSDGSPTRRWPDPHG